MLLSLIGGPQLRMGLHEGDLEQTKLTHLRDRAGLNVHALVRPLIAQRRRVHRRIVACITAGIQHVAPPQQLEDFVVRRLQLGHV